MNTISRSLVLVGLALGCAQAASAQTADEVVEKHLTAIGGRQALGKLKTRSMSGQITLTTPAGEISGTIEILNEEPNKTRTLLQLDLSALGAGQMVQDSRFDGKTGYVLDSLQGDRDITGNQLENMKNSTFPHPFLNYKEMGATVELGAKEKVGDRDAYLLIVTPKSGSVLRQYIDVTSFLPIRQVTKVDTPQTGEFEQTSDLFDIRDVDGVKIPFELKVSSALQNFAIKFTKVEHNVKIDQALFSKPAQK